MKEQMTCFNRKQQIEHLLNNYKLLQQSSLIFIEKEITWYIPSNQRCYWL